MNIKNIINKFLICATLLFTALPIFAVEVDNYTNLINAINNNESIIQITNDFNFGNIPLTVSTNTVFTTIDGSTFTIKGNSTASPMLTFRGPESSISNINFSSSTGEGPAIAVNVTSVSAARDYSTFTINNVTFSHNTSSIDNGTGGALSINSAQGTFISHITFSTNSVTGVDANGGALYYQGEKGLIGENIIAYENTASQHGGAIYASTLTLTGSTFSTNTASSGGGAIYVSSGTISNTEFSYNTAGRGGAIYASTLTLIGNTFSTNTATIGGGAIYVSSGTIASSSFFYNEAQSGAAIYASTLTLTGSTFSTNTASFNGGAIYVSSGTISNSGFSYNVSSLKGGAIYASTLTLMGSSLSYNTSHDGGAVYLTNSALIQDSSFLYNSATSSDGGAIYNEGDTSILRSTFANNTASSKGGAIYNSGTLKIVSGTFKNNQAATGGAIFNNGSTATLLSTNFSQNSATDGGAVYLNGGTLNINNTSDFIGNTAANNGGAIYATGSSEVYLKPNGGAITFRNNTDSAGPNDIYLDSSSSLHVSGGGAVNFYGGVKGAGSNMDAEGTTINWYSSNAYDGNLTVSNGALNILNPNVDPFNTISLEDSSLSLQNGVINSLSLNNPLTISGDIPLYLDIDPANTAIDTIDNLDGSGGSFSITNYNQLRFLSDTASDIPFLIDAGSTVNINENEDFYGPLYIYNLQAAPGGFNVMHTNRLNPIISVLPIAANSKVVANINTVNSLYNRIDVMLSREYLKHHKQQELRDDPYIQFLEEEIENVNNENPKDKWQKMVWFVPNAGYQKVNYGNDVDNVKNIFYGGLIGIDYPFWTSDNSAFIPTIFMGYLGAKQKYREATLDNNSFAFGGMLTYMKNFAILSGQAYITNGPESYKFKTYEGSFDIFSFTASVKGEMDIDLFNDFVMQPALTAIYNISNLQNYTTATFARMYSTRFQNFLLIPSVKFMASYGNWFPYLGISYNLGNAQIGKVIANELTLPKYKLKNFGEISAGVENTFFKNYSGYVQLSTYVGNSKGVAFQMGIRGYLD